MPSLFSLVVQCQESERFSREHVAFAQPFCKWTLLSILAPICLVLSNFDILDDPVPQISTMSQIFYLRCGAACKSLNSGLSADG